LFGFLLTVWIVDVLFLGWIGQLPVEAPFVQLGLYATFFYFAWFIFFIPVATFCEGKFSAFKF
jgi:ubiquinol-cytochrome c reductase cytochrome b subunit